jgi:hypothetical protein
MGLDIVKLITDQMANSEPVLGKAEMKAVALATISQNFAVAARRGRPIFASNLVKDMSAFNGAAAGGMDLGMLLMLAQLQKDDKPEEVEATVVDTLSQRLDGIESAIVKIAKGK